MTANLSAPVGMATGLIAAFILTEYLGVVVGVIGFFVIGVPVFVWLERRLYGPFPTDDQSEISDSRHSMRTVTKHGDDIWPVVTVWLPTGLVVYFIVYKIANWYLLNHGYAHKIPVDICGGGSCNTIQMVAADYHAGPIGIGAMLLTWGFWFVRDELKTD